MQCWLLHERRELGAALQKCCSPVVLTQHTQGLSDRAASSLSSTCTSSFSHAVLEVACSIFTVNFSMSSSNSSFFAFVFANCSSQYAFSVASASASASS